MNRRGRRRGTNDGTSEDKIAPQATSLRRFVLVGTAGREPATPAALNGRISGGDP